MITFALQTGSSGNCYYYESGDVKLLFDAGITWRCAAERLQANGIRQAGIQGIFISHDHSDHTCCAGVFHRKLNAPLFTTPATHSAIRHRLGKIKDRDVKHFDAGDTVDVGHVKVHTISTPHDAVDPCAFVVDDGVNRVGILSDLGHCFPGLRKCLEDLDVAFIESNYDEEMLRTNMAYPEMLKRRIRSPHGHLENSESALMLKQCCSDRLQSVVLCHLSGENNRPDLALSTHKRINTNLRDANCFVAPRNAPSPVIQLNSKHLQQTCFAF